MNIILGPYDIYSPSFLNKEFVDNHKRKRTFKTFKFGEQRIHPLNSIILHQKTDYPKNGELSVWYEHEKILGRQYYIYPTPCGVYITTFENNIDVNNFGIDLFCFGKKIISNYESNIDANIAVFEFDKHVFTVQGISSINPGIYECTECENETISSFGFTQNSIVNPPQPAENFTETLIENNEIETENPDVLWDGIESEQQGYNTICQSFSTIPKTSCVSHEKPDISNLMDGRSVIVYTETDSTGISALKSQIFNSSINENIVYYKSLSRGRLINDSPTGEFSTIDFEIFDDIDLSNVTNPKVIFITGPLKGETSLPITNISRETHIDDSYKIVLKISTMGRKVLFEDSNNDNDVEFAISGDPTVSGMSLFSHSSNEPINSTPSMSVFSANCLPGPNGTISISDRFAIKGNLYLSNLSHNSYTIKEIKPSLSASPGTKIWVQVWIQNQVTDDFEPVFTKSVISSSFGRRIYSTGPINVNIPPSVNYLIGIGARDNDVEFYRETTTSILQNDYWNTLSAFSVHSVPPLNYPIDRPASVGTIGQTDIKIEFSKYDIGVCIGEDDGTQSELETDLPGTLQIGSGRFQLSSYHATLNNLFLFDNLSSVNDDIWISEFQQEIQTNAPGQIVHMQISFGDSIGPNSQTLVFRKDIFVENAGRQWISSGQINLKLENKYYLIGVACGSPPSVGGFQDTKYWVNPTTNLNLTNGTRIPIGKCFGRCLENIIPPAEDPLLSLQSSTWSVIGGGAYHQKLFVSSNPSSIVTTIETNQGHCQLLGDKTSGGINVSITNSSFKTLIAAAMQMWSSGEEPAFVNSRTLLQFKIWLNLTTVRDISYCIFRRSTENIITLEKITTVPNQGPGLQKYSSGSLNFVLNAGEEYYIGVLIGDDSTIVDFTYYYGTKPTPLNAWWGAYNGILQYSNVVSTISVSEGFFAQIDNITTPNRILSCELCFEGSKLLIPRGACCVEDDCYENLSSFECSEFGGVWMGQGELCSQSDCSSAENSTGPCCLQNNSCLELTEEECLSNNSNNIWLGESADCSECVTEQTQQTGACCLSSGECLEVTQAACNSIDGSFFLGTGSKCIDVICPQSQENWACCLPDGSCVHTTESNCLSINGTFNQGSNCGNTDCPPSVYNSGACCTNDGCLTLSENECLEEDGVFYGIGSNCSNTVCETDPTTESEAIDIPDHIYLGKKVPVSNPSVAVFHNHLSLDQTQYINIAYQAFEENQWNVYLRQIRITDKEASDPTYQAPYDFSDPEYETQSILLSTDDSVQYEIIDEIKFTGSSMCALFKVKLTNGQELKHCDEHIAGTQITSCGYEIDNDKVYVEATRNLTGSCDISSIPPWQVGTTFTGIFPPVAETLGGDSCVELNLYPIINNWCFLKPTCNQTKIVDDPVCSNPYIAIRYNPEDMWNIELEDKIVSRVKYHMSVSYNEGMDDSNQIDFMFIIDHSGSMQQEIDSIRTNVPLLAELLREKGYDVRFGFIVYGRLADNGEDVSKRITYEAFNRTEAMFDGLSNLNLENVSGGFTDNIDSLVTALGSWFSISTAGGLEPGYVAVQFACLNPIFEWRENSQRYIMLVTDEQESAQLDLSEIDIYTNDFNSALSAVVNNNTKVILATCTPTSDGGTCVSGFSGDGWIPLSTGSGWLGDSKYPVNGPWDSVFSGISGVIAEREESRIIERDESGTETTFIKNAEIIITYDKDLRDIWTNEKSSLSFVDHVPSVVGPSKGLTSLPFDLYENEIYNINPVHINGDINNWVSFSENKHIRYDYPNFGNPGIGRNKPILIDRKAMKPKIITNYDNDIIIAYESYKEGITQISIKGTGDFSKNSIRGSEGNRVTKFAKSKDFSYQHDITTIIDRVNQLCDVVVDKNNVVHISWQSNRDNYWEIYYANGYNLFEPVRITKFRSKSSFPTIDIDNFGNIFIVYQDNRFDVFEIMMSYKKDRRIIPLLQQDPYLDSLRSGYKHYTNVLPVLVSNPKTPILTEGLLWGSKSLNETDEDFEHYIFGISTTNANVLDKGGETSHQIVAMAGSTNGYFYGVSNTGKLLLLSSPTEEELNVEIDEIEEIGQINLQLDTYKIDDATIDYTTESEDQSGTMWILLSGQEQDSSNPLIIVQIDLTNANIIRQSTIFGDSGWRQGALTCTTNGDFYLIDYDELDSGQISKSSYPVLTDNGAIFSFESLETIDSIKFVSITNDYQDSIFGLTSDNKLYSIDTNGSSVEIAEILSLSSDPYEGPLPITENDIACIGYQFSSLKEMVGTSDYFDILIEFYDNKNDSITGQSPLFSINSRDNLESFINSSLNDPYEPYFEFTANGVFLESGSSGIVIFDSSHYRPGNNLSYPYGFDTNQTYFLRAYTINSKKEIKLVDQAQEYSFSCNKCSRFSPDSFDKGSCSYSFIVKNENLTDQYFNFKVLFYSDEQQESIVKIFNLMKNEDDLQYCEVDNLPASQKWEENGLFIKSGQSKFVQIYPGLDQNTGFLCGIYYYVSVLGCLDSSALCSEFSKDIVNKEKWTPVLINEALSTGEPSSIDVFQINDNIAISWCVNFSLKYSEFISGSWNSELVDSCSGYVSLKEHSGQPIIAYRDSLGGDIKVAFRKNSVWQFQFVDMSLSISKTDPKLIVDNNISHLVYYRETHNSVYEICYAYSSDNITWTKLTVDTVEEKSPELSLAIINEKPFITYKDGQDYWIKSKNTEDFVSSSKNKIMLLNNSVYDVSIVPYNDKPFISCSIDNKLYWATSDDEGVAWYGDFIDNKDSIRDNVTIINNQPHIVYGQEITNGMSLKHATPKSLSRNNWSIQTIDSNTGYFSNKENRKVITGFNHSPIVFMLIEPSKIYSLDLSTPINGAKETYFCDCSSSIFNNQQILLTEAGKWYSSAFGSPDIRITDSNQDQMRPNIDITNNNKGTIAFEDYSETKSYIKIATFNLIDKLTVFGTGTMSWFNYDPYIEGFNPSIINNIYDWSAIGFQNLDIKNNTKDFITNSVSIKNCNFSSDTETSEFTLENCNIKMLNKPLSEDQFISNNIIKKVIVHPDYVLYFTTNTQGKTTPIVSSCEIKLRVWGSPEIIAYRIKNEDSGFLNWCNWEKETSNYYIEINHVLSKRSGVKNVCIQAITYSGITSEWCVPIIADYRKPEFQLDLFYDSNFENKLPTHNSNFVASTGITETGEEAKEKVIYVKVTFNEQLSIQGSVITKLNYDILQQGDNDLTNQIMTSVDGFVFYGNFTIYKEDSINKDGIANILVKVPGYCEHEIVHENVVYIKDKFNYIQETVETISAEDSLSQYRDSLTGLIGNRITVMPAKEDPYLIFGMKDYFLTNNIDSNPAKNNAAINTETDDNNGGESNNGGGSGA